MMLQISPRSLCLSLLVLPPITIAQITIASVPTSSCAGNPFGTATYSTQLTLPTQGTQRVVGGNFWQQAGVSWTFSTDTKGVFFSQLGIPGWGANPSIPQADHDALNLDDSKTKWTLTLPTTVPSAYEPDIVFLAQGPANASSAMSGTAPGTAGTAYSYASSGVSKASSYSGTGASYSYASSGASKASSFGTVSGLSIDTVARARVFNTASGATSSKSLGSAPGTTSSNAYGTLSGTAFSKSSKTGSISSASSSASSSLTSTSHTSSSRTSTISSGTGHSTTSSSSSSTSSNGAPTKMKRYNRLQPSPTTSDGLPAITKKPVPEIRARVPVGPKYRRADAGTYQLTIVGTWNCLLNPSGTAPKPTGVSNAVVASECANNEISANIQSWSSYAVPSYMSSLLNAAAPNPTFHPQVDGAEVIHNDVNPPGAMCTYTSKCDSIGCPDVKDYTSGTQLTVQRFLAYTSVVNLNNYLYSVASGLLNSGTIGGLVSGNIVTTFFTNPSPAASWEQIMGIFTPLLGMFSALLGPFSAIGSAALGAAGGLMGAIGAGSIASSIPPVVDKRFSEYSTITSFIGEYLKSTVSGIEQAYNLTIGPEATAIGWTGSPYAPTNMQSGYFGSGLWVDSDYTQGLTDDMLQKFVRIFTYKAINYAYTDSGCMIFFVPYNTQVKDTNGNMIPGIDQNYCQTQLKVKDNMGTLTICDAPGGMARIVNTGAIKNGILSGVPQNWDATFSVLPNENFAMAGLIKGSINSWRAGDFGYDAANPYNDAFSSKSGFTDAQLQSLSKLVIAEETAGFFNIPVCETLDLRFFPLTSGTSCTACGGAYGGTKGSTKKFMDNVSDTVKKGLQNAVPPDCTMGYEMPVCSQQCPSDVYVASSGGS